MKCGRFFRCPQKGVCGTMFGGGNGGRPCGSGKPCGPGKPQKPRPGRRNEAELFGIILVILGTVTIGAFLLPSKVWLIVLGAVMVFLGIRLVL